MYIVNGICFGLGQNLIITAIVNLLIKHNSKSSTYMFILTVLCNGIPFTILWNEIGGYVVVSLGIRN